MSALPKIMAAWKEKAKQLKIDTYALALAYRDPRVPFYAKTFAAVVAGYAFSPIDLIPDFIPVLGYLDDLLLVPLGVALALKMIPPEVMAECRQRAAEEFADGKPVQWISVVIIILIWLMVMGACGWLFMKQFAGRS